MSEKKVKKAMIIGLDGCVVPTIKRMADEGELPAIARILNEGSFFPDCLVPIPNITPPNWTTIVTGAWPGTHNVTDYNLHNPGTGLHEIFPGFSATERTSETLWESIARAKKRSIVFNYPTAWPAEIPGGINVGNFGTSLNEERTYYGAEDEITRQIGYGDDMLYTSDFAPKAATFEIKSAEGWSGDVADGDREAELKLVFRRAKYKMADVVWNLLIKSDCVLVCEGRDTEKLIVKLQPGEFSPVIKKQFRVEGEMKPALFRAKLMKLTDQVLNIYFTGITALDGWAKPNEIISEFESKEGLPTSRGGYEAYLLGWIDEKTFLECIEFEHQYYGDVVPYLLENKPWDLFAIHLHAPDWIYHTVGADLNPESDVEPEDVEIAQDLEREMYKSLDRCVGKITAQADDETLIILTSDHGCKSTGKDFDVNAMLEKEDLLVWGEPDQYGHPIPDWSKTQAYAQRFIYIYLNVKGRDPQGVVNKGKEYEKLRTLIINALYDYTDPDTGIKPIALALRREDALLLGLKGDRIGDIVYLLNQEYGKDHGPFLPTAELGAGSVKGLLAMSGPNIRKNQIIDRCAGLTDIVPTICYLTNWPIPTDCEGSVLYQAFENIDFKREEHEEMRRENKMLKRACDPKGMC